MDPIAVVLSGFLFLAGVLFALSAKSLILLSKRNRYTFARIVASTIVAFLEQSSAWDDTLLDGIARKERAILLLTQWAESSGAKLTFVEMDWLIEEAVLNLLCEIDHTPDGSWMIGSPVGDGYETITIR